MTESQILEVLEHLVASVGKELQRQNARIRELENADGVTVLENIDWERQYPNGQLGKHAGGLWAYSTDTGQWRCVVNAINNVEVDGSSFVFERSNGEKFTREVTLPKPVRRKPVKVAA